MKLPEKINECFRQALSGKIEIHAWSQREREYGKGQATNVESISTQREPSDRIC
jgi:hypothetical protein